jgi:hypothetical protein
LDVSGNRLNFCKREHRDAGEPYRTEELLRERPGWRDRTHRRPILPMTVVCEFLKGRISTILSSGTIAVEVEKIGKQRRKRRGVDREERK